MHALQRSAPYLIINILPCTGIVLHAEDMRYGPASKRAAGNPTMAGPVGARSRKRSVDFECLELEIIVLNQMMLC